MKKQALTSQFKLIFFAIILGCAIFFFSKIGNVNEFAENLLKGGDKTGKSSLFSGELLSEAEQDSLKKQYHGYWIFSGNEGKGVHLDDYIEVLKNGVVWEYERRIFTLPYGGKDTLVRMSNAYLLPREKLDSTKNGSVCYLRLIRQNWQIEGAFCFGPSQLILENAFSASSEHSNIVFDWTAVRKDDSTMIFNGIPYKKYSGELTEFFPDKKAVPAVDDPAISGCVGDDPHLIWIREKIITAIQGQKLEPNVVLIEQKRNIEDYYIPYCFSKLVVYYGQAEGKELTMTLTVSPTGTITDVKLKGAPSNSPAVKKLVIEEIKKWIVHGSGAENKITVKVIVKSHL